MLQVREGTCDRAELTSPHIVVLRLEDLSLRGVEMGHGVRTRPTSGGRHSADEGSGVHLAAGRGNSHVRCELVRHPLRWCARLTWVVSHARSAHGMVGSSWVLRHSGRRMRRK